MDAVIDAFIHLHIIPNNFIDQHAMIFQTWASHNMYARIYYNIIAYDMQHVQISFISDSISHMHDTIYHIQLIRDHASDIRDHVARNEERIALHAEQP